MKKTSNWLNKTGEMKALDKRRLNINFPYGTTGFQGNK